MFSKYIYGAVVVLTMMLFGVTKLYLDQRDESNILRYEAKLSASIRELEEKQQAELAALKSSYDQIIADTTIAHEEILNDLTYQLISAREDARQEPMAFGDDFVRDILRVDCLRALGVAGTESSGIQTCDNEAANADPSSQGLPFTVITPEFLASWAAACDDWDTLGTADGTVEDWHDEYGNFDPALCEETLVAMTPEGSLMLRRFVQVGWNYTARVLVHSSEQEQLIDQISK